MLYRHLNLLMMGLIDAARLALQKVPDRERERAAALISARRALKDHEEIDAESAEGEGEEEIECDRERYNDRPRDLHVGI